MSVGSILKSVGLPVNIDGLEVKLDWKLKIGVVPDVVDGVGAFSDENIESVGAAGAIGCVVSALENGLKIGELVEIFELNNDDGNAEAVAVVVGVTVLFKLEKKLVDDDEFSVIDSVLFENKDSAGWVVVVAFADATGLEISPNLNVGVTSEVTEALKRFVFGKIVLDSSVKSVPFFSVDTGAVTELVLPNLNKLPDSFERFANDEGFISVWIESVFFLLESVVSVGVGLNKKLLEPLRLIGLNDVVWVLIKLAKVFDDCSIILSFSTSVFSCSLLLSLEETPLTWVSSSFGWFEPNLKPLKGLLSEPFLLFELKRDGAATGTVVSVVPLIDVVAAFNLTIEPVPVPLTDFVTVSFLKVLGKKFFSNKIK